MTVSNAARFENINMKIKEWMNDCLSELLMWLFPSLFKMSEWSVIIAFCETSTQKKNKN